MIAKNVVMKDNDMGMVMVKHKNKETDYDIPTTTPSSSCLMKYDDDNDMKTTLPSMTIGENIRYQDDMSGHLEAGGDNDREVCMMNDIPGEHHHTTTGCIIMIVFKF